MMLVLGYVCKCHSLCSLPLSSRNFFLQRQRARKGQLLSSASLDPVTPVMYDAIFNENYPLEVRKMILNQALQLNKMSAANEKEVAQKEKEVAHKEKEVAHKEKEVAQKEKESALKDIAEYKLVTQSMLYTMTGLSMRQILGTYCAAILSC